MSSIELDIVNKTLSLVAKRGSGKSVLLKYLVEKNLEHFEKVFVICPTEEVNSFYAGITEDNCIFSEWREDWASALIQRMTTQNKGKSKEERKNVLLILDDCMADTNFHQSKTMKILFSRSRHINISIFCTCQYLHNLPPLCRNNMDWVMVGQMNKQSQSLLCDEYMSGEIEKTDFIKLYNRATKDYSFLIINNTSIKDNDDLNQIYGIIKCPEDYVV